MFKKSKSCRIYNACAPFKTKISTHNRASWRNSCILELRKAIEIGKQNDNAMKKKF